MTAATKDRPLDESEKERNLAEAESYRQDARKSAADADLAEIMLAVAKREEDYQLAQNFYHQTFLFDEVVGPQSVAKCVNTLTQWSRTKPGCDIELVFNSPGGSVTDGLFLWDFLQGLKAKGHKLTTVALGEAMSMAGILLQAGDVRAMGRESWLMIHEVSFGARGKTSEIEDRTAWVKKVQNRVLNIFADRSGGKLSVKKLKANWNRKDWFIDSLEALDLGLVDEVR